LAGNFEEEAPPTRGIWTAHSEDAGVGASSAIDPGREPGRDLLGEISHWITGQEVYPDTGVFFEWRIGDQQQLIVVMDSPEVLLAVAEDRAMHGGPEPRRVQRV
jgi:hypothetical protein